MHQGIYGMNHKALLNLIPIAVVAAIVGGSLLQQWQRSQANRPDYDQGTKVTQPQGTVNGADQIQVPQTEIWQLVRVTDGDTIVVKQGMKEEKIRFCGIDAPEQAQPLGDKSTAYLSQLLSEANGKIGIVPVERDRYGRLVAEVFVLGTPEKFVQEELLKAGMAYVYPQYVDGCWNGTAMKAAEAIGQEQKAGVWSGNYQKPWEFRKQRS
jgi:endonuclease YncB( thermonuclease family)